MVKSKWLVILLLAAASAFFAPSCAYAKKASVAAMSADDDFLALRDAARGGDADKAGKIADRLGAYAIPSYVDYYRLKSHLMSANNAEILDFLSRYEGSAIADRLRNDWLLILGYTGDWKTFDEQLPLYVVNDDRQVKCYALLSQALKGQNVAADARLLLIAPKEYGDACPALMKNLVQNGQFRPERCRCASPRGGGVDLQRDGAPDSGGGGDVDNMLTLAIDKPGFVVARGPGKTHDSRQIFIVALGRAAKIDVPAAVGALERAAGSLNKEEQALAWAAIAYEASLKQMAEAPGYWHKAGNAPLSISGYQWRVRSALMFGDWSMVESGIEAMPEKLRAEAAWTYWLGRAFKVAGRSADAQVQFQAIAEQTNFYGQLALEESGRQITIPQRPLAPTAAEVAQVADNPGFRRALKFLDLNLRTEGSREWNWELRKMSEHSAFCRRRVRTAKRRARSHD